MFDEALIQGLKYVIDLDYIFFTFIGVGLGFVIGVLPGLTATMGVAILTPLTFGLKSVDAFGMLMGIYVGAFYGGGITACLLHVPGTPSSAVTILDGYPMAQRGEGGRALGLIAVASLVGGIISTCILLAVAPPLARFAIKFGPPELFLVVIFGLIPIASMQSKSIVKGLIAGIGGMLLGTAGTDPITGNYRFTGDYMELYEGFSIIVALIGLYSISQTMFLAEDNKQMYGQADKRVKRLILPWRTLKTYWATYVRSSAIGTTIGAIPGEGTIIATFVAYNEAKRWSKHPEDFGKGCDEGVIAAECSDNACEGGTFIPTLALGIPGNLLTAVFLGAMMLHGFTPGPRLIVDSPDVVYSIILGRYLAHTIMLIIFMITAVYVAHIIRVPQSLLIPIIIVLSVLGTYSMRNSLFDVFLLIPFGVLGYFMRKNDFPIAAMCLGIILGPLAESELRRSLLMSGGSITIFFSSTICLSLIGLIILMLIGPPILNRIKEVKVSA